MPWVLRLLGFALAVGLAVTIGFALPVEDSLGLTPIHGTRIDSTVMLVGFTSLFWMTLGVVIEHVIAREPWKLRREQADPRVPFAYVVHR